MFAFHDDLLPIQIGLVGSDCRTKRIVGPKLHKPSRFCPYSDIESEDVDGLFRKISKKVKKSGKRAR
jgi:hypothetical protein